MYVICIASEMFEGKAKFSGEKFHFRNEMLKITLVGNTDASRLATILQSTFLK